MQPAMTRARPRGVAALAVATAAAGAATILRTVWEPFRSLVDTNVLGATWLAPIGLHAPPDGVVGGLLGAAFVVSGVGLMTLRPWAWWLAVTVGAAGLLLSIGSLVWMAVWAGLLVYLVVVHEAFSSLRLTARPAIT
jgi:hypothetical protein